MHECWMLCVWVCFVVYTWVLSKYESALATWAKAKWIICLFVSDNCDFFFHIRSSLISLLLLSIFPSSWKHTWFVFFSLLSFVWHNPRLKYACVACARFAIYRVYRVSVILIFSMFCFFVWRCAWWHLYCPFRFFFLFILLNHITIDSTIFFYKLWFHCQWNSWWWCDYGNDDSDDRVTQWSELRKFDCVTKLGHDFVLGSEPWIDMCWVRYERINLICMSVREVGGGYEWVSWH